MGEVFKLNHCYNMDCLPAMELFPDNYFDLAVVDPPYFSGPERRGFYGSKVSKIGVHRDYPVSPAWSKPEPEYFRELLRVCRRYIVWGCNYFDYQFATGRIVWDKCNGNSSFSDCEIAATNLFSSVRMFRYMWSGMMQGKSITEGDTMQGNKSLNEKRIHPTQKPVALYDWIFKNYAEPGQKILDTHLGSGSSRIAAYEAGLGFIGFEIDQQDIQLAALSPRCAAPGGEPAGVRCAVWHFFNPDLGRMLAAQSQLRPGSHCRCMGSAGAAGHLGQQGL